ncbi:winged helix family two component transcriptional regulator [Paraburkholderia unamae]|uniref:response regulator n=1 Tax=Paraburkholderia unamae TaxID=219649 RepID=UPI000DC50A25|nr:response regulator [Paraburkholderia unamae]RAR61136.1 winged helix family two component transcriptional regulator [Paraburkholderia unamae]
MTNKIFLVDDDPVVRDVTAEYLQTRGFSVTTLPSARAMQLQLRTERPQVVVLDIMMPEVDGISALRTLRDSGDDLPVILLTARNDVIDRVLGLEFGADDYVGKPFDPGELVARIRTVMRRRSMANSTGAPESRASFRFGPYELDFRSRELYRDEVRIALRSSEFTFLKLFVNHAMTILSRERIIEIVYGETGRYRNRSLDVAIWRLRRLIETDPSEPRYLQTVWGHGYVFVPDGEVGFAQRYGDHAGEFSRDH